MAKKKYYTVDQANLIVPKVDKILRDLILINDKINILNDFELEFDDDFEHFTNLIKTNQELHKLFIDFYAKLEKLLEIGVVVKDIEEGLADFYSKFEGREIFLCYKMGERRISHWHETFAGYEDRQSVEKLKRKTEV